MTMSIECPRCGDRQPSQEALEGRRIRCRDCGATFVVGTSSGARQEGSGQFRDRPARVAPVPESKRLTPTKSRREDDDEDDGQARRPSSEKPVGLIVGLAVGGGLLLLGGVILVVVLATGSADPAPEIVVQAPVLNPGPAFPPVMRQPQPPFPQIPQMPVQPFDPGPAVPADADAVTRAVAFLRSDNIFSQSDAAKGLAKMPVDLRRRDEVVGALKGVLSARGPLIPRKEAALALGTWAGRADVPYVIGLLDHDDGAVQEAAIDALGKLKDARAADALATRLKNFHQRAAASQALKDIGLSGLTVERLHNAA